MGMLDNRVAIVTGSGGIGDAAAQRLAEEGAKVVIGDINFPGAERGAAAIVANGGEADARHLDISDEESIRQFYRFVQDRHGRLDILHNNAAASQGEEILRDMAIEHMDAAVWDRAFIVNTRGTMLMIKHAIPMMREAGGGSIINTSSGASLTGDLFAPAYASSTSAITTPTNYVATQYGKTTIRCNVVSPGLILTQTARDNAAPGQFEDRKNAETGKRGYIRVDLGGGQHIKKKTHTNQ